MPSDSGDLRIIRTPDKTSTAIPVPQPPPAVSGATYIYCDSAFGDFDSGPTTQMELGITFTVEQECTACITIMFSTTGGAWGFGMEPDWSINGIAVAAPSLQGHHPMITTAKYFPPGEHTVAVTVTGANMNGHTVQGTMTIIVGSLSADDCVILAS